MVDGLGRIVVPVHGDEGAQGEVHTAGLRVIERLVVIDDVGARLGSRCIGVVIENRIDHARVEGHEIGRPLGQLFLCRETDCHCAESKKKIFFIDYGFIVFVDCLSDAASWSLMLLPICRQTSWLQRCAISTRLARSSIPCILA